MFSSQKSRFEKNIFQSKNIIGPKAFFDHKITFGAKIIFIPKITFSQTFRAQKFVAKFIFGFQILVKNIKLILFEF